MAGKKSAKLQKPKKVADWDAIREDFLIQNLDPTRETPYTYAACAKTWGVTRKTVSKHANVEKWRVELQVRAKAQADATVDRRQDTYADAEREVRERHVGLMRDLIEQATVRLNSIKNPKKLTINQMLKMFQFALPEEREAMGMPKYVQVQSLMTTDPERGMETPGARIARRRAEREVKAELLEILSKAGVTDADG